MKKLSSSIDKKLWKAIIFTTFCLSKVAQVRFMVGVKLMEKFQEVTSSPEFYYNLFSPSRNLIHTFHSTNEKLCLFRKAVPENPEGDGQSKLGKPDTDLACQLLVSFQWHSLWRFCYIASSHDILFHPLSSFPSSVSPTLQFHCRNAITRRIPHQNYSAISSPPLVTDLFGRCV